ncbi:MAG: metallophosphoesterase [Solirubrobacterales bacterium]
MAEQADSYQREIAEGLNEAFDDQRTPEAELDLDSARVVVFSDHHRGARDGADDFWRCERAYHAALGYYLESGFELYVLGDVEELWECRPEEVLEAYPETLALEAEFHKQGRYRRFWGNHDDQWNRPGEVEKHLHPVFPDLAVAEALKLEVTSGGERLGLIFLAHGHQGTADSERYAWFSRLVVRHIWRPIQRRLNFPSTSPSTDYDLRQRHDAAMFAWAQDHPAKPVLIAGHTHRPVFGTSRPPKVTKREAANVVRELEELRAAADPDPAKLAALRAELEFIEAAARRGGPPPLPIDPPCYFNTGCCSFGDGDVTGLEIADGEIRLVRWPNDADEPASKVLVGEDMRAILDSVTSPARTAP